MPADRAHSSDRRVTVPCYVMIPMRGRLDLTAALLDQLRNRGVAGQLGATVLIYDNGSPEDELGVLRQWAAAGTVDLFETPGMSITDMWNAGWDEVCSRHGVGPADLAILNNDIEVPDRFLHHLSAALRSAQHPEPWAVYPDYHLAQLVDDRHQRPTGVLTRTSGTYRLGGMSGWAFMVRAETRSRLMLPTIDAQFKHWCGDDDLAFQVEQRGGGVYRVDGLPLFHGPPDGGGVVGESTGVTAAQAEQRSDDLRRCYQKWGR
jgi:hypothetical protein